MSAGTRYPARTREEMPTEEEKAAHDYIKETLLYGVGEENKKVFLSPEDKLLGHFAAYTYSPAFGKAIFDVVRAFATLPLAPNVRETVILSTAGFYRARYPAYVHYPMAKSQTTLTEKQIELLHQGEKPTDLTEEEAVAFDVVQASQVTRGPLSNELFDRSVRLLGKDTTLAVLHLSGFYALISTLCNGCGAVLPYGETKVV
ncbi:hypothetical protein BDV36DRAFT_109725 [Aspergillus pseudocaelatus]|uniref:Carboxymuconolactone decarboxylase-like domain-containing protein n=1 Tax=Aspergillus pseudocaelatus TaxID=1825620 RepID=A0ABQ6W0W6_9EURO|nr:hypothetical protein BDV36DRAFT_109725 [Aspergillus pseudocaelatus]